MGKITALTVFLLIAISGSALAANLGSGGGGAAVTTAGGLTIKGGPTATVAEAATSALGKMSTGVYLGVNYTTSAYALITKHLKGSRKMGTSNDSTAIFFFTEAQGALAAGPSDASQTAFATGWTSM